MDEEDRVIGVCILAEDDEYEVEMSGLGEDLLEFLDEEVEVTGIIEEERDGTKWISVSAYDVLEDNAYEDSEEEYGNDLDLEDLDFDYFEDQSAF